MSVRFGFTAILLVLMACAPPAWAQAACEDGAAADYPCSRVDLLAFMPVSEIGGGTLNDIWGWTDPDTGREYAIVGRFAGTSFVDITDPENPVYLGHLPTHQDIASRQGTVSKGTGPGLQCHDDCEVPVPGDGSEGSAWRDMKVHADHVFVVSEERDHGMQVFDLRRLRDVQDPPQEFDEDAHYAQFGSAHNIVINPDSATAIAVGSNTYSGGLHFVDISDPANPAADGGYAGDGYTHDAQCVNYQGPDTDYTGREICFNSNVNTLTIVDISNRDSPEIISRRAYPRVAYAHQGWLSEDQRWFYLNDELADRNDNTRTRTLVWDLATLEDPQVVDEYYGSSRAIHHNSYVKGDYLFQSNYTSGLRILDIRQPDWPHEYAFFDSQPATDEANFTGSWSNFPWFDSGVVVFSDVEDGLFIVRPRLPELADGQANLQLDATVENPISAQGRPLAGQLRIELENSGPLNASGVELVGSLPVDSEIRLTQTAESPCSVNGRVMRCRLGEMAVGETRVLDLEARSRNAFDDGLVLFVSSDLADPDTSDNRIVVMLPTATRGSGSGCSIAGTNSLLWVLALFALGGLLGRRLGSPNQAAERHSASYCASKDFPVIPRLSRPNRKR